MGIFREVKKNECLSDYITKSSLVVQFENKR